MARWGPDQGLDRLLNHVRRAARLGGGQVRDPDLPGEPETRRVGLGHGNRVNEDVACRGGNVRLWGLQEDFLSKVVFRLKVLRGLYASVGSL